MRIRVKIMKTEAIALPFVFTLSIMACHPINWNAYKLQILLTFVKLFVGKIKRIKFCPFLYTEIEEGESPRIRQCGTSK
jgi:hypothetical protein